MCRRRLPVRTMMCSRRLSVQGIRLACVLGAAAIAGCSEPPPPPPPPPPSTAARPAPSAPAAPPATKFADVDTAAKVLVPYFYLMFDWGFSPSEVPSDVMSQGRRPVLDTRTPFLRDGDNLKMPDGVSDEVLKSEWSERSRIRALVTTPTLEDLLSKQIGNGPALYQAFRFIPSVYGGSATAFQSVFDQFVNNVKPSDFYLNDSCGMSSREAGRAILAIYVAQALADADAGNLHRAHVILSDTLRIMSMGQGSTTKAGDSIEALFTEVVNQSNLDRFTAALSRYVEEQADALVVSGENASVLKAAGLRDGAEFIRAALLAKYQLLVMPLIAKAQQRARNAGYRSPESLAGFQKQIGRHVATLRGSGDSEKQYLQQAVDAADGDYAAVLDRFRGMWGGNSEASLDKTLDDLRKLSRPVQSWYEEKQIAATHCPLQFVSAGLTSAELSIGLPLEYDETERKFKDTNVLDFVAARQRLPEDTLGEDVKMWCGDASGASPLVRNGLGHFMLGWYWLEAGKPRFARQAWIDGARALLESPEVLDEQGGNAGITGLLHQVNAYRLLVAASFITAAPPGVIIDRTNTYETEVRANATDWNSTWTLSGYPEKEATRVIDSMFGVAGNSLLSDATRQQSERYPFFDYRFRSGSVPDVLVDEAVSAKVFNSDGLFYVDESASPPEPRYKRISELFRGFVLPVEFSEGAKRRLKQQ